MNPRVKTVKPNPDYTITLVFTNGEVKRFDVKPYLNGSVFKELTDESYFRLVRPAHHGIMWPHEQDFSSDTIVWDIENAQQG